MLIKRTIPLAKGKIRAAWGFVKAQLTRDGTDLSRYVKTWQLAEGNDVDDIEPAAWTVDLFPLIRVEMDTGSTQWFNQVTTRAMIDYTISCAIEGTDQGDATDLFEAIIRQLYPGDGSLYAALKTVQVMSYSVTAAGVTRKKYADGRGQVFDIKISLNHELRTQV